MRFNSTIVLFLSIILFNSYVEAQNAAAGPTSIKTIATSFRSEEGFVFDAKIVAPPKADRNGCGVLMLGGGQGNDLNWTAPGFVNYLGKKHQLTITGKSHADAPLIAKTLAEHGFVVMYWSTIRQDDPQRDAWPEKMTFYPIKDLFRFSKSALAHFRGQQLFDADRST
jgi:hypothetical protein